MKFALTVPKSSTSGMASGSSGSTGSMASGNAAGNMTQMLGPQYIMGQTVPYFQQPMYASFEDLQLMQQRMPHMVSLQPIVVVHVLVL